MHFSALRLSHIKFYFQWEKFAGLEPVINSHKFPVESGMDILTVTVGCKYCCIVSRMNKMHMIRSSIYVIDINKNMRPNNKLCGTSNAMLDIECYRRTAPSSPNERAAQTATNGSKTLRATHPTWSLQVKEKPQTQGKTLSVRETTSWGKNPRNRHTE